MQPAAHPPHGKSRPHTTKTRRRDGYERHGPEDGALYQTIATHWPAFDEEMEAYGGLPDFVRHQFERFLTCGILREHGCLHLQCRECGHSQLVAFSCKGRGVCNSCAGRRMVDAAVHLEANVLPAVNIRHWVCTLPWGIRALLGYDKRLCAATLAAFVNECFRSLKRRAKALLGLSSVRHALTGAVAAIQRTDSSLRLNVHFHVLVLELFRQLGVRQFGPNAGREIQTLRRKAFALMLDLFGELEAFLFYARRKHGDAASFVAPVYKRGRKQNGSKGSEDVSQGEDIADASDDDSDDDLLDVDAINRNVAAASAAAGISPARPGFPGSAPFGPEDNSAVK